MDRFLYRFFEELPGITKLVGAALAVTALAAVHVFGPMRPVSHEAPRTPSTQDDATNGGAERGIDVLKNTHSSQLGEVTLSH